MSTYHMMIQPKMLKHGKSSIFVLSVMLFLVGKHNAYIVNFHESVAIQIPKTSTITNITTISLDFKNITSLEELDFEEMYSLRSLHLTYNSISYVDNNTFKDCPLAYLDISNNPIRNLDALNLDPVKGTLETLRLRGCELLGIPDNYFQGFDVLRELELTENTYMTTFQNYAFFGLNNLHIFTCDACYGLVRIEELAFYNVTSLTSFTLTPSINIDTFPCLDPNSNHLTTFTFTPDEYIMTKITNIPSKCISALASARDLNIQSVNLLSLQGFKNFSRMETLNLLNTNTSCIGVEDLNEITALRTMTIKNNPLEEVFSATCDANDIDNRTDSLDAAPVLPYLTTLKIFNTKVVRFPNLTHIPSLQTFDFTKNQITVVPDDAFEGNTQLTTVLMERNLIGWISPSAFRGCSKLKTLRLNTNFITSLQFLDTPLPALNTIDLGGNNITTIQDTDLTGIFKATALNFSYNHLTSFPMATLQYMPRLQLLDLNNTDVTTVDDPYRWLNECNNTRSAVTDITVTGCSNLQIDDRLCWNMTSRLKTSFRLLGVELPKLSCCEYNAYYAVAVSLS